MDPSLGEKGWFQFGEDPVGITLGDFVTLVFKLADGSPGFP